MVGARVPAQIQRFTLMCLRWCSILSVTRFLIKNHMAGFQTAECLGFFNERGSHATNVNRKMQDPLVCSAKKRISRLTAWGRLLVLLQGTPFRRVCHTSRVPNAWLLESKPGIRPLDASKSTDGNTTETSANGQLVPSRQNPMSVASGPRRAITKITKHR